MAAHHHAQILGLASLDRDALDDHLRVVPAVAGQQLPARVAGLDVDVLHVAAHVRDTPADAAVVADQHQRHAREGRSGDVEAAAMQTVLVPRRRHAEAEMGIVDQQRPAGGRAAAVHHPGIAPRHEVGRAEERHDVARGRRWERSPGRRWSRRPRRQRQGGARRLLKLNPISPRLGCQDERAPGRRQQAQRRRLAQPCGEAVAHQLLDVVLAQREGHQLAPGEDVERRPGLRRVAQQRELDRQAAAMGGEEGVDALAIGLEDAARLGVEQRPVALGGAAEAEREHQPVGAAQRRSQQLREPAVAHPAVELHLPETVLGVHVALRKEEVVLVAGIDLRHAPAVPQHLDRRDQSRRRQPAAGLRPRAAHEPHRQDGGRRRQHGKGHADRLPDLPPHALHRRVSPVDGGTPSIAARSWSASERTCGSANRVRWSPGTSRLATGAAAKRPQPRSGADACSAAAARNTAIGPG